MLETRFDHCSCAIQSEDGSTHSIIVIGGTVDQEDYSETTEILNLQDKKWVQGPDLPIGITFAACVALPPTANFACVVIGGCTEEEDFSSPSSNIYGLDKSLRDWTLLGEIRTGRRDHIALPLS